MSMDFTTIGNEQGPYNLEVCYWRDSAELQICPEFRSDWRLGLGELLRGLGITLEDCRTALTDADGVIAYVVVFDFWGENGAAICGASTDFQEARRIRDDSGMPHARIEAWRGDRLLVGDCKEAVMDEEGRE